MRRSRKRRDVLVYLAILVFVLAVAVSYVLIFMMGRGELMLAIVSLIGGLAVVGSLASVEIALWCLLVMSFTDGLLKGLDPTHWTVFIKDLFIFLGMIRWVWLNLTTHDWSSLRKVPLAVPAALFILYCIAETVNTSTRSLTVAAAGLRSWIVWLPVVVLAYDALRKRANLDRMLLLIIVLALFTGAYGILQYNIGFEHLYRLGQGFAFYNRYGWDQNTVRATSTFVAPGAFGGAMSLVAIVALAAAAYFRPPSWKILAVLTSATCVVGLATSASRAPLLGLLVGTVGILLMVRKPALLFAAALIALLGLWQLDRFAGGAFGRRYNEVYLNAPTIVGRSVHPFSEGLTAALDHPFGLGIATGVGIGRAGYLLSGSGAEISSESAGALENEYGRALRELGLPGTLLFLWMLFTVVKAGFVAYRRCRTTQYRLLAGACVGITLSVLAQLLVGSALYVAPGGLLFWLFYAIAVRLPDLEADDPRVQVMLRTTPEPAALPAGT